MKILNKIQQIFSGSKRENESQTYIISYPKSGRTWLRLMVGRYLTLKHGLSEDIMLDTDVVSVMSGLPRTTFTHDHSAMLDKHAWSSLSNDKTTYRDKRVILLGRDIKDTLVSAFHQATKRINVFEGDISQFIRSQQFGAKKVLTFYQIWLKNKEIPKSFLYISYEDMHNDAESVLTKVLSFMGEKDIDKSILKSVIKYGRFDNMKKIEQQGKINSSVLTPGNIADNNSFKARKGIVGGYINELSTADIDFIDNTIGNFNLEAFKGL